MGARRRMMRLSACARRITQRAIMRPMSTSAPAGRLAPQAFFNALKENGVETFYGVPDSLLKDFAMFVSDEFVIENTEKHIITSNEGTAVGLAAGYYMASGKPACVYLQNSGLGNTVNPIM